MLPDRIATILRQFMLAARNLTRQRKRSALALATVGGGVAAFVLAGGFINWIFQDLRESTIHSQLGHIQITRPGYFESGLGDPYRYLLPDRLEKAVVQAKHVVTVAPRLAFSGLLSKGDETIAFLGEGVDPLAEKGISRSITIIDGHDMSSPTAREVLVGEGLAANLGARAGDTVVLLVTTADGGINAVEVKISGIFATVAKAYDDTVLRAPISVARDLMRVQGATSWVVLLSDTKSTDSAMASLSAVLSASEYQLRPWYSLADFYNKTVELFSKQIGVVRLLIALIVVLSISNTLSMSVMERTTEIGTSMAIGVRRSGILGLFLSEGVLLGIAGGLIGVALALVIGTIVSAVGIPMPPPPGMARGYIGEIAISPALVIDGFVLAFTTTLLASIFPAWKASRMNVVDALRHQR